MDNRRHYTLSDTIQCPGCGQSVAMTDLWCKPKKKILNPQGGKPWEPKDYSCDCNKEKVIAFDSGDGTIFLVGDYGLPPKSSVV